MRVDTDDFARPRGCGKNHLVEVEEILIEPGAVNALEEAMSEGFLKEYISPASDQFFPSAFAFSAYSSDTM